MNAPKLTNAHSTQSAKILMAVTYVAVKSDLKEMPVNSVLM